MMPARLLPAVTARMTTAACRLNPRPWMIGCRTLPSTCCTRMTMPSTISAVVNPLLTRATRTAKAPATKAPMIGMNPPKKVSTASGMTSGTPRIHRPRPMKNASMNPTSACWRMNSDRVVPRLVGQRRHVARGPRAGLRGQPRHAARPVLEEEEHEHQREDQVEQAVADDGDAGQGVAGDVLRVALDRVDRRVDGLADLVLAEVERRALQPLLDVLECGGRGVGELGDLVGDRRRDRRDDPDEGDQEAQEDHRGRQRRWPPVLARGTGWAATARWRSAGRARSAAGSTRACRAPRRARRRRRR